MIVQLLINVPSNILSSFIWHNTVSITTDFTLIKDTIV